MWPLFNENKQQLHKKEKNAKLSNTCFFFEIRKKFISKDMKAINYKMKILIRFVHSSKVSPLDLQLSRICLTSTKKVKCDKNQKFIYFFL